MDYSELLKALRDDNACLAIKTAHEAANAIEQLENYYQLYMEIADKNEKTARKLLDGYPKWIPVAQPPQPGRYLVLKSTYLAKGVCDYYHSMATYTDNLNKANKWEFPGKEYKRPGWYNYDSEYGDYEVMDVKYWMPLPEPPKEETE